MPAGFEATFPPDDTGRVTFERFRYQAHVAFRFCLEAAAGGDVQAFVCEHFEDVAVQLIGGWRLAQIKTRDPELGPWRLSDLLARRGALRALHRTHQALAELDDTDTCRLEARLEGAIARDDERGGSPHSAAAPPARSPADAPSGWKSTKTRPSSSSDA
jgi:hypothetical protein